MQETGNEDLDFSFKPITKGLGFHQKDRTSEVPTTSELKTRAAALADSLDKAHRKLEVDSSNSIDRGSLAPFYETNKQEDEQKNEVEEISLSSLESTGNANILVDASMFARFGSWVLDIFLVSFLFATTLSIIFVSTFSDITSLFKFIIGEEIYIYFTPILFLYYTFYFSFLEKTQFSTIGKSIFNLKVISDNEGKLKIHQTFLRSLITLFSLCTLGLGSFIDFQSRISGTRVIKDEAI